MIQEILLWFTTVTTLISGSAFLFKIPSLYRPDAYLIDDRPATGTTSFETVATFVFGCIYLVPVFGLMHAHLVERTASARRSATIAPMMYHFMSTFGVLFVFPESLNPEVAPLSTAAGMHMCYGILFAVMYYIAQDDAIKTKAW